MIKIAFFDVDGTLLRLGHKELSANTSAAVLRHYDFSKAEAIAFGDGHNDIEMLEAVGMGVAMGNAKDEVKAKADFVCKSVEDDGIYHYCIENKLIF